MQMAQSLMRSLGRMFFILRDCGLRIFATIIISRVSAASVPTNEMRRGLESKVDTMKIALLSDIHGNLSALEPTLESVAAARPDLIAVLGDSIGYYYDASSVIDLIRECADVVIRGNHERMYIDLLAGRTDGRDYRLRYGRSLDIAKQTLTESQNDWLHGLSDEVKVELAGKRLTFTHEAPNIARGYLYPDSNEASFEAATPDDADALFLGHTHYPFAAARRSCLLVNPGSVGQSRDVGGLAQWAIVHLDTMAVELRRTPYDIRPIEAAAMRHDGELHYLRDVLNRGP